MCGVGVLQGAGVSAVKRTQIKGEAAMGRRMMLQPVMMTTRALYRSYSTRQCCSAKPKDSICLLVNLADTAYWLLAE